MFFVWVVRFVGFFLLFCDLLFFSELFVCCFLFGEIVVVFKVCVFVEILVVIGLVIIRFFFLVVIFSGLLLC